MPSESDLRDLLRDPGPGTGGIDLETVVRRSRARRRPRLLASAAIGGLAVVGVAVPVGVGASIGGLGLTPAILADEDAAGGAAQPESATAPSGEDGATSARPEVLFLPADPPWRIDVTGSSLAGDPAPCTTDDAVASSRSDGDGVPMTVELVPGAGRADAARIADCLAAALTGGTIAASGPQ